MSILIHWFSKLFKVVNYLILKLVFEKRDEKIKQKNRQLII